jgi:hypothetical protein
MKLFGEDIRFEIILFGKSLMQKKNIEFTEDAIRQKIELSPIEKYIKFGTESSLVP